MTCFVTLSKYQTVFPGYRVLQKVCPCCVLSTARVTSPCDTLAAVTHLTVLDGVSCVKGPHRALGLMN